MTPNRLVIVLSPIFIAVAGWLSQWVATHFPGSPHLDPIALAAIFIAGGTWAGGHITVWLLGWQKYEARIEGRQR